jgi:hypothetical protein
MQFTYPFRQQLVLNVWHHPGDRQDALVAHEPPLWKRGTNVGCNPLLAAIFQCGISCGLSDHTDMQLRQH